MSAPTFKTARKARRLGPATAAGKANPPRGWLAFGGVNVVVTILPGSAGDPGQSDLHRSTPLDDGSFLKLEAVGITEALQAKGDAMEKRSPAQDPSESFSDWKGWAKSAFWHIGPMKAEDSTIGGRS